MKVAIACSGLGRVRRGFETFAEDLFHHLQDQDEVDVTLFKGGGPPDRNKVPLWNVPRRSRFWRAFAGRIDPYIGEQMTFALSLARHLKREDFDLVHISDGQLGSCLLRLFPSASRRFRTLFSNGGPLAPQHYARFDFVQQVNPLEYQRATAFGIPEDRMMLLPYGISTERFRPGLGVALRERLDIPLDEPVVLTVGAWGAHKRHEFLLKHLASMHHMPFLLIVGHAVVPNGGMLIAQMPRSKAEKIRFASFPYESMPEVYGAADIYVHGSLREGFGLALLEAMASGVPVVHHDEPSMNWIVGKGGAAVDMTNGALLVRCVESLLADRGLRDRLSCEARRRAEQTYSWSVPLPRYIEMYERVRSLYS